ncbi:MAG: CHAT domain-containing protein [Phenylobacterium sp.]|uniref:CHAT domain-containing protein n=1 Tax=Phenylobacterium sp. TaxID=1871053 RepID=UPI001A4DD152|nr:CHAT domain-containing protein [Phenylobacterium sp.]MBL8773936.1 CHAT domain-containing protein [Phenylobacterium sp.]
MTRFLQRVVLALAAAAAGGAVQAAPAPETFPLGQSAESGAVCDAVRDYQDAVAQGSGAKAWRVRCRGYGATLGRLYQLPPGRVDAWRRALQDRATCQPPKPAARGGERTACRTGDGASPYVVFTAPGSRATLVAEGLAPLADVLEAGLRVVGGGRPPAVAAVQTSAAQAEIAADFPNMQGLAAAEAAAAVDPQRLLARGYVQNNEWRFDEAEQAFRAIVNAATPESTPAALRADALLNLAINVSNAGRFGEADVYFAEAEDLVPRDDLLLRARAQTYRALHERNRGSFAAAISSAQAAMRLRAAAPARSAEGAAARPAGGLVIDAGLAGRLNAPSAAQGQLEAPRISVEDQLAAQDAQALQIIGTSQAQLGDRAAARASLAQARTLLVRAGAVGRVTAWLRARIDADIAALDLRDGRADDAARGYADAVATLRTRHAGSAAEGALLLDLGRAQAVAGREGEALATFQRAIEVFRSQRGGLGGSADATAPYFDLLLARIARGEDADGTLAARFFEAAQIIVPSATAETVNRLAARVAAGDDATAGLARAFEDARRRVRATESAIAAVQAEGAGQEALRRELAAQLAARQAEANDLEARLFAADPRYNQLIATGATAAEIRKALRPGEAYLKVLPLGAKSYGVVVTPEAVKPYAIPLTRAQIDEDVRLLRVALEPGESLVAFDVARAADLFERLAGPAKAELLAARHLIYEPTGLLVSLPVGVLVAERPAAGAEQDYRRTAWLGARLDTSLVTSGASFLQSRAFAPSRASQPYLGFGDPALARPGAGSRAYNLSRSFGRRSARLDEVCGRTREALLGIESLPETAQEVRAVGASLGAANNVVVGADFNDEALIARRDLSGYRVLYFATHGLLPQPDSCLPEPALVTSLGPGGESDALLDTGEILNLRLDADLVVLAACDTGGAGAGADRTGLTGGGEALGGLTRAMIYAGSRTLVVSHWSVDSESVVRLMTGVFASDQPTLAGALRRSQQALLEQEATAHPYFWAPFTLVGDGARPLPRTQTGSVAVAGSVAGR